MIVVSAKTEFKPAPLKEYVEKAKFRNFSHAAASLSKDVKATLETAEGPSMPGKPPHTHKGAYLRLSLIHISEPTRPY